MLRTFLLLSFAITASTAAQPLDGVIRELMAKGDVPGLSIVVLHGGKNTWHRAYGVANAETRAPLTDDAMFESASLAKPLFAYAVLKLADRGVLDLDAPLQRYLPEPVSDERMKLITARMVLAHTTGFQNEVMPGQTLEVHFTPGSRFSYSGAGFLYLQRVLEHVTGKSLTQLMQELVFRPLGMRDSSYVWLPEYERCEVYGHTAGGRVAERRKPSVAAMAMLHTTPLDYARFVAALMRYGRRMMTPQVPVQDALSWGLGIGLERTTRGTAFFHHGDNNGEFNHLVIGYPDRGDAVIVFTNSGNGFSIMPEIVDAVLGGPHPAFAWMGYEHYDSPAKTLLRDIRARGAALALQAPLGDELTEQQINAIGYALLQGGRVVDAVRVFERNAARFPSSANVFDSLGEGYAAAGEREKAIAGYERSLALDPKNGNAAEWLKKLRAAP